MAACDRVNQISVEEQVSWQQVPPHMIDGLMATQWFYKVMGDEFGPCTAAELKQQAALGNIPEDSLVRKGTDGQWVSAWRVKGLFDHAPKQTTTTAVAEPLPIVQDCAVVRPDPPAPPPPPTIAPSAIAPAAKRKKNRHWITALLLIVASAGSYALFRGSKASINPFQSLANTELQSKLDRAIELDHRNVGIDISVYYRNTFDKSIVVFDLQGVSGSNSRLDVFRVLLEFAEAMQTNYCDTVELAFRGETKFTIDGFYFRTLGRERDFQNPAYTIRTFPENLKTPSGLSAYPEWTGGLIGVLNKQMEDFNDFHDKWYLDEIRYSY